MLHPNIDPENIATCFLAGPNSPMNC